MSRGTSRRRRSALSRRALRSDVLEDLGENSRIEDERHDPPLHAASAGQLRKDQATEKKVEAHARSKCGDVILTAGVGCEAFTVISAFTWG